MQLDSICRIVVRGVQKACIDSVLDVLCFHRVMKRFDPFRPDCPTLDEFEKKIRFYKKIATFLPLGEASKAVLSERRPGFYAAVTFDDGYQDNLEIALPFLRGESIRPTFFIASSFVDGPMMFNDIVDEAVRTTTKNNVSFDDLGVVATDLSSTESRRWLANQLNSKLKYLHPDIRDDWSNKIADKLQLKNRSSLIVSSAQLRSMQKIGADFGGHTHRHALATSVSKAEFENEVRTNKSAIEAMIQCEVSCFAFPNGKPETDFSLDHQAIVKKCGYQYAYSTKQALAKPSENPFSIPRFSPWSNSSHKVTQQLIVALLKTVV